MRESPEFVPLQPASEKVRHFLENEPGADWRKGTRFLVENFPQMKDDKIEYLIEGSAAISLLGFKRSAEPNDIDLLVAQTVTEDAFRNSKLFDAKIVQQWFEDRHLDFREDRAEFLMRSFLPVPYEGKNVLVLNPTLLACSKLLEFRKRHPREQDQDDIRLLHISQNSIDDAMRRLGALP